MPRILTLTLADIYTGLTFHGTPSPAHKSESGKREAAEQGSGLVLGVKLVCYRYILSQFDAGHFKAPVAQPDRASAF